MKKKIILLILSVPLNLIAQNFQFIPTSFNSYYFTPQNLGFATPQTAEFAKYGNLDINHYNGLLNLEIPIMEYKDHDFNIPVSIKYISDGFIPGRRPSLVGMNWILNVGGVITREVIGSPDDNIGNNSSAEKNMKDGLLVAIRNNAYNYSQNDLWNFNVQKTGSVNDNIKHDLAPDIFTFNFGNHHGKFIIGNNGNAVSLNDDGYKIDINGVSVQAYGTERTPSGSMIKITTPDGYTYEFGGNSSYLEYTWPNNPQGAMFRPVTISSWYLNSITAPNKRKVYFSYSSIRQTQRYKYFVFNGSSGFVTTWSMGPPDYSATNSLNAPEKKEFDFLDFVYVPMLDKITIDETAINFTRNRFSYSFYNDGYQDLLNLSLIDIRYQNRLIKKSSFTYEIQGSYFFLKNLKNNSHTQDPEAYGFEYNYTSQWPNPQTIATDHWGFWNGGYNISEDAGDYLANIESRKAVNTTVFKVGLLKKVVYPTGGITEIEYEYNRYNNYKKKNSQSLHYDDISSVSGIPCGGARVYSMKDSDQTTDKVYNYRTFQYKNPQTNNLNGAINLLPKYKSTEVLAYYNFSSAYIWDPKENKQVYTQLRNDYSRTLSIISSNTLSKEKNMSEYHIGYPDVIEYLSDGSQIHYNFSTWTDVPDDENINTILLDYMYGYTLVSRSLTLPELKDKYSIYTMNDMSAFRGKLLKKTIYSGNNTVVLTENYTYNLSQAKDKYAVSTMGLPYGNIANKVFLVPCRLVRKQTIDQNSVSHIENYKYNKTNLVSELETIDSNGLFYNILYKYPIDYDNLPTTDNIKILTDKNIINEPVEIIKAIKTSETGEKKAIDGIKYDYKDVNGMVLRNNLYQLYTSTPLSLTSSTLSSSFIKKQTYQTYNKYGVPTSIANNDMEENIYLWSYKGQYLIAEIKNTRYSDVVNVLGQALIDRIALAIEPSEADLKAINNLRSTLSGAHVATYTYSPLVGIISSTDPMGISTFYEYDETGRLRAAFDNKRNIVNKNTYKYKNNPSSAGYPMQIAFESIPDNLDMAAAVYYTFRVLKSGGPNQFYYRWKIQDDIGQIIANQITTTPEYTVNLGEIWKGQKTVTCTLTDELTEETVSISKSFNIYHSTPIFENIQWKEENGECIITANLNVPTSQNTSFKYCFCGSSQLTLSMWWYPSNNYPASPNASITFTNPYSSIDFPDESLFSVLPYTAIPAGVSKVELRMPKGNNTKARLFINPKFKELESRTVNGQIEWFGCQVEYPRPMN
ncbi:MAG: hypothetical protein LBS20_07680 [Prevotella sp.]|jgi:YD repeat-containing protein|nr:hypothetical protein [Prevotella sp.]